MAEVTLKIFQCANGHRWEAEVPDPCPECGAEAKTVKKVMEEKTEKEAMESGDSGMAADPDPYGIGGGKED